MHLQLLPAIAVAGRATSRAARGLLAFLPIVFAMQMTGWAATPAGAAAVPLLQPTSVAYDAAGNLFFAESRNNVVRRLTPDGTLETVAGSSVQGFAGDGGDALAAELDTPRGVALDAGQNLYIADTHNNRVRRVDGRTHVITTIAGTGIAGFSGDGGAAGLARLRAPLALALDPAQHLFVADSGNQRVRSIDLVSGVISTVAGDGRQGFTGDGGPATLASFDTPSGLVIDASGDLFIADSGNRRVREVSSASRQVLTVAGATGMPVPLVRPEGLTLDAHGGLLISDAGNQCVYLLDLSSGRLSVIAGQRIQAYAGDRGVATLAMLDTPMGVAVAPNGDVAIADSGNARIRLVATAGGDQTINTVAGLGSKQPGSLVLSGATEQQYGSTAVSVTLPGGRSASGPVSLIVVSNGRSPQAVPGTFQAGMAHIDLSLLPAGSYQLTAKWAGDSSFQAATSAPEALTVRPVPLVLEITNWSIVYGSNPPVFVNTLSGVLPQDQGQVSLNVGLPAVSSLVPGVYPLAFTLSGAGAGNYVLSNGAGQLTIGKAPVQIALNQAVGGDLLATVKSTTAGVPSGAVTLLNSAGGSLGMFPLDAMGSASLSTAGLAPGKYSVTAVYSGDSDFLAAQSSPQQIQTGSGTGAKPAPTSDFVLSSVGSGTVSAPAGGSAVFSLQVRPTGDALSSPILLNVTGLPLGATSSFAPALIPPSGAASVATLTIQLPRPATQAARREWTFAKVALGVLCPVFLLSGVRRRPQGFGLFGLVLALSLPLTLAGCGDRVAATPVGAAAPKVYPLVVTATATLANGSALQHTATVTLTVP